MFKNPFKKSDTPIQKTKVFEWAGHKFYTIEPQALRKYRGVALSAEMSVMNFGMSKRNALVYDSTLKDDNSSAIESLANGDISAAVKILQDQYSLIDSHQSLVALEHQRNIYEHLASYVLLIDDEPHNEIQKEYMNLKAKLCREHIEISNFFFHHIIPLLNVIQGGDSYTSVWEYLALPQNKKTEDVYFHKLETHEKEKT